jgi:hypothetical protein
MDAVSSTLFIEKKESKAYHKNKFMNTDRFLGKYLFLINFFNRNLNF